MFKKITTTLSLCCVSLLSSEAAASETVTYQQGLADYSGATSTTFNGHRQQITTWDTFYSRYDGKSRLYNIEHFELGDLSQQGLIESAKLTFYKSEGYIFTSSNIYVRQILDPDNLGPQFATGWKVGHGFRAGANSESRDDSGSVDVKWRLSDPDSPDDLNADYFQGVLSDQSTSPYFSPEKTDVVGTAYEVDVTTDLQCIQLKLCVNQGWALYHSNVDANMQYYLANSRYSNTQYRPKLVITYAPYVDELEPLVIESFPYNEDVVSNDGNIELTLMTNETASCKYDLSPLIGYENMRYNMVSADGINHTSQWPVASLDTRFQLYGKCQDQAGNISQTPHVYTFTVTGETSSGTGETGTGETDTGETGTGEPYTPTDLLPGLSAENVWKTLYATTDQNLTITLGEQLASDGSASVYQVEGAISCQDSVVGNQCTFNHSQVSTQLIAVNFSGAGESGSHNIVVVTQDKSVNATTNYTQNKNVISPDYGLTPPLKGESRVDPVTGVTISRLTNADDIADSNDALIVYSRYSPENSSGDYLLVFGSNSTSSRVINRKTGELVTILTNSTGSTIGEANEVRWDTSGRHPNRIYYVQEMKFWMIDDITNQTDSRVVVKDFTNLFPNSTKIYNDVEGDSSNDSDHWVWMAIHYDVNAFGMKSNLVDAYIHYQISTDTVHTLKPADLAGTNLDREKDLSSFTLRPNMVEMSPLGTGIVIHSGYKFAEEKQILENYIGTWFDGPHLWPIDFDFNKQVPVKISCCSSHSGWAFDEQEREMFVSQNNRTDRLDAIYVNGENAGYDNRVEVASHSDFGWAMGFHYGKMPQNKPGWLFMNSYSQDDTLWGANQFMMIQVKPEEEDPIIWRLSPAYNKYDGEYRDEAPAAINLSGNRIYWSSNWGGALDHREVFVIELPDNWDKALDK